MTTNKYFAIFFELLLIILLSIAGTPQAAAVEPDPGFSNDGFIAFDVAGSSDALQEVTVLQDGSVLALGHTLLAATGYDVLLVKYDSSGNPFPGFGTAGRKIHSLGPSSEFGQKMIILPNGQILILVTREESNSDYLVARLNANGELDINFGVGGVEVLDVAGTDDTPMAFGIQSTGKIVVAGTVVFGIGPRIGLVRYGANGGIDSTFGTSGTTTSGFSGLPEHASSMTILNDDSILVAGRIIKANDNFDFFVAKYTDNGQPDLNFGQNGYVSLDFAGEKDFVETMAIQSNKILLAGYTRNTDGTNDLAMARFEMNGSPDSNFGTAGKVVTNFGTGVFTSDEKIFGIAILPDQKIIITGKIESLFPSNVLVGRYTATGNPDNTFNNGGFASIDYNGNFDIGFAVAVQTDGKIVVAASTNGGDFSDALLLRLTTGGSMALPTSCTGAAFCDLFDNPIGGPVWTFEKPSWSETAGKLVGTPSGKKAVANAPSNWVASNLYSVHAGMQSSGGSGNTVWLMGWYQDNKNYIELQMKEEGNKWILKHRANGTIVSKAKGIKDIQPNQMYSVKMTFDGSKVEVFVDDASSPLISMTVAASVQPGTVGFQAKNTTARFESIRVDD